jgi:type I restriction enzyme M protein
MNTKIAQSLKNYLDNKQKKAKVVEIYDFEKAKVKYSEEIKSHRVIDKFGSEEMVRAYILAKLVNELDYEPKNIELEKEYLIGTPKTTRPRIDVIVRNNNGDAYLYIELKSPEEYEKNKEETIKNQPFSLASQEKGQGKRVRLSPHYFNIENKLEDRV